MDNFELFEGGLSASFSSFFSDVIKSTVCLFLKCSIFLPAMNESMNESEQIRRINNHKDKSLTAMNESIYKNK